MNMMVIPVIIGALGMIPKGLVRKLGELETGGWAETIQTTALLGLTRILKRFQETWGDLQSLCERPSVNAGVKNSQEVMMMMIL